MKIVKLELADFELEHIIKALDGRLDDLAALTVRIAKKQYDECEALQDKIRSYKDEISRESGHS